MSTSYSVLIAKWCIDYYKEFTQAPGVHIQDIYEKAVRTKSIKDDSKVKSIQKFLTKLSKEYERADKYNAKFMLKEARRYFNTRAMDIISKEADKLRQDGKEDEAIDIMESYKRIEIPEEDSTDINNVNELLDVFTENDSKPLFYLPGAMGQMLNEELKRQSFIGIMGPEKIGKTWLLLWLAKQSCYDRCNTLFVQAGDMSRQQQLRRLAISITNDAGAEKYAGKRLIPCLDCEHNQLDTCPIPKNCANQDPEPVFEEMSDYVSRFQTYSNKENFDEFWKENRNHVVCTECKKDRRYKKYFKGTFWFKLKNVNQISRGSIIKAHKKFFKRMRGDRFRLATYSNSTLTPDMLYAKTNSLRKKEGFVADTVIIDYPDIMASEKGMDHRHSENTKWKRLRAFSQDFNCLVIAVTQADANSYNKHSLGRDNFSEDKRKYSHVTSFYTLNQTPAEKACGILRVGNLMSRDNELSIEQCVILQHLSTGRAHIASYF